ncbi:hypothetical protein TWF730_001030 [Orbilia blumenaviensis]|uniref:Uncharacterized protein n=1 Tax=Orbilia blumenaviensis TaxID=1796055 RepID=A0AAV9VPL3_9PEZI
MSQKSFAHAQVGRPEKFREGSFVNILRSQLPSLSDFTLIDSSLPEHKFTMLFLFVTLALSSYCSFARADSEDTGETSNFSNNLFSDLGPLLTLFGERVALQFLSHSTSWVENLIFACAPIGILTGVISAIRVGGARWLQALVGRAREPDAAAELELMSSTSEDICELWNGSGIVRVIGSPSTVELIYDTSNRSTHSLQKLGSGANNIEILSLEIAKERGIFVSASSRELETGNNLGKKKLRPFRRTAARTSSKSSELSPSSQAAPNIFLNVSGGVVRPWEYAIVAVIGVALQFGVLIYDGIITLHPNTQHLNLASGVPKYAFPLTLIGTLGIMLGSFLCAYVVEASTVEETWEAKANNTQYQVVWLQRGQTVGDQSFRSYAIYDKGDGRVIRTSRKAPNLHRLEFWTLLGSVVTVVCFVLQFIGLRAMNWSASVAQLLATGIMILLKAYVRRNLSAIPQTKELPEGYELDLMAKDINKCHIWRIVPTSNVFQPPFSPVPTSSPSAVAAYANEILSSRVRLSELTKWPSQFSETVDELVSTLQNTMHWAFDRSNGRHSLKKGYEDISRFTWKIPVSIEGDSMSGLSELQITLKREKIDNIWTPWTVDKEEVAAMFSLWMSSFTDISPLTSQPNLWIVGPNNRFNRIIYDWWISRGTPSEQIDDIPGFCRDHDIDGRRIFNRQTMPATTAQPPPSQIGVVVQASLQRISAQYLLGSFLGDLMQCVEKLGGDTRVMDGSGAGDVTLFDDTIRSLAEVLQLSSSVSVEDSYRILIPILCELHMLQDPFDTLEEIVTISKSQSKSQDSIRETCDRLTYLCERKANILTDQDRYGEAGGLFLRLIDVFNKTLGSEDQSVPAARKAMTEFAARFIGFPIDKIPELSKRQKVIEPFRLHAAAARGDLNLVFQTLLHGVGANTWNDEHEVPVGLAVQYGYIEIARLILFYGGPIDKDLLYAVIDKHNAGGYTNGPQIIKFLLLNLVDKSDLLLEASAKGYHVVLDWMAQTGTDINQMDKRGYTPLHLAAKNGNHEVITILLKHNADPNVKARPTDQIALHLAVEMGHYKISLALIDSGSDLLARDKEGMAPLHVAARQGKLDLVKLLIDRGSDINGRQKDRRTALHLAAIENRPEVVEEFISHKETDQNVQDNDQRTALHLAASKLHFKEVMELLSRNQPGLLLRDKYGRDALITAIDKEDADEGIIEMLIQRGSDLSAVEDSGRGGLEYAAIYGYANVIKNLLAGGASLTNKDGFGRVALHYAAMGGSVDTVRLLLDNGVAVDAVDKDKWTPLHYASRPGHKKVIEVLKAAGADVNSKDRLGNSADHYFKDGGDSNYWTRMLPVTPFWSGS